MKHFQQLAAVLLLLSLAGCGGSPIPTEPTEARDFSALNELGEAYRTYQLTKKVPPKKLADVASSQIATGGNGLDAVKKGEILVQWGATLPSTGEEPGSETSPEILAYWKTVPESGGYVLTLDRRIKKMTAEEFKAAPRPAGSDTAVAPATKK